MDLLDVAFLAPIFVLGVVFLVKTDSVTDYMDRSYSPRGWKRGWRRFMVRFVGAAWVLFALGVLAYGLL
jgi:hypothetical protein